MNPIIKLQNVSYSYLDSIKEVLRDISLEIYEGQFITILGPNGSGKSTLARMLNGLLVPTHGEVIINNGVENIDTKDAKKKIWAVRRNIGVVFQNPDNQIVGNTVEEDIAFSLENYGIEPTEIRERIDEVLETLDMGELKTHDPNYLSGGQKQKVAIAGVVALKPKVIIFDEATSMLDPEGKKELLSVMQKLNKEEKITIIQITHSIEEALLSDRIIIISNGEIVTDDTAEAVLNNRELLQTNGLEVPLPVEISYRLSSKGYKIKSQLRYEELIEELWKLV